MNAPFSSPPVLDDRPRRRRWPYVIGLLLLLLLLPVLVGVALYLYFSAVADRDLQSAIAEADQTDPRWRLADVEADRAVVPDAQNSGVVAMAAKQLLPQKWPAWEMPAQDPVLSEAETKRQVLEQSFQELEPQRQLSREQIEALRTELKRAEPAVTQARKIADLPQGRYPITYSPDWISTLLPYTQDARLIANMLGYDVLLQAQDGDADGALASCRAILNDARSVGNEPMIISQLVRIACRTVAVNKAERVLAQGEPSDEALRQFQQLLEKEESEPLMLIAMRGERAGADTLLEAIQTGKLKVTGRDIGMIEGLGGNQQDGSAGAQAAFLRLPPFITGQRAAMLRYQTRAVEAAKLPPEQQPAAFQQLEVAARSEPILVRLLAPAVGKMSEAYRRSRAQLRCAIVATAAERYRRAKGQWPTTLAALKDAGFIQEVPNDLYDGKPLRMRRLDDGLVIYSVGPDGQDNGGHLDRKNPIAAGSDLGFQLWDVAKRRQPPAPPKPAEPQVGMPAMVPPGGPGLPPAGVPPEGPPSSERR
jgi:hypothetical protein